MPPGTTSFASPLYLVVSTSVANEPFLKFAQCLYLGLSTMLSSWAGIATDSDSSTPNATSPRIALFIMGLLGDRERTDRRCSTPCCPGSNRTDALHIHFSSCLDCPSSSLS